MSDIWSIIKWCIDNGFRVVKTKNSHWKIFAPKGIVIVSGTPGDKRAFVNIRSDLRRFGIPI